MELYQIDLTQLPEITHAHSHRTQSPRWALNITPGLLEVTYVKTGPLVQIFPESGLRIPVPENGILVTDHRHRNIFESPSQDHMHYTVIFRPAGNVSIVSQYSDTDIPCAYLPCGFSVSRGTSRLFPFFQELTQPGTPLRKYSLLLEILNGVTDAALAQTSDEDPLCSRARRLIAQYLDQKLSTSILAGMLGISGEHLSRTFRRNEGMTPTDYINREKLRRVRELLSISDITLEEAARSVAMDAKYLSRLYRKYYASTAREYMQTVRR